MSLDGPIIHFLQSEIKGCLLGGRVLGVGQPAGEEVEVGISQAGQIWLLRLSAHPTLSHICFRLGKERPKSPSGFGSTLQRVIGGSTLFAVYQPDFDRILRFVFRKRTDLIPFEEYTLVAELLGRHSNLILLDRLGKVLATLRSSPRGGTREISPGANYHPPPPLPGLNPLQSSLTEIRKELEARRGIPIGLAVEQGIRGITEKLVGEILGRVGIDPKDHPIETKRMDLLLRELGKVLDEWRKGVVNPEVIFDQEGRPDWLSITEIRGIPPERRKRFGSVNEALCYLFDEKRSHLRLSNQKAYLLKLLGRKSKNLEVLLSKLGEDYLRAENAEDYKLKGDLIISHLRELKKGANKVRLPNLYDPEGEPIEVELDPQRTPQENAQLYYRLYGKAKRAKVHLKRRIAELNERLKAMETLRDGLEGSNDPLMVERAEAKLRQLGVIPPPARKAEEEARTKFIKFHTSDGWEVLVGKGASQNEELTHRIANPDDVWLHAQGVPGSHVIIRRGGRKDAPSQRALSEAASAAAFFSRARTSKVVPVIYTLKKWVRRPRGAKPGMVVVQRERTLFVEPKRPPPP